MTYFLLNLFIYNVVSCLTKSYKSCATNLIPILPIILNPVVFYPSKVVERLVSNEFYKYRSKFNLIDEKLWITFVWAGTWGKCVKNDMKLLGWQLAAWIGNIQGCVERLHTWGKRLTLAWCGTDFKNKWWWWYNRLNRTTNQLMNEIYQP